MLVRDSHSSLTSSIPDDEREKIGRYSEIKINATKIPMKINMMGSINATIADSFTFTSSS